MRFKSINHWGSYLWGFIHSITIIDYDDSEKNEIYNKKVRDILINLNDVFPCPTCKITYNVYLDKLRLLDLREGMVLFKWSVELHNEVNRKLNKPEWIYEMALLKWSEIKS